MFHNGIYFFILIYFSFSRISSALIPLASSFFSTASASAFFASSSALAFLASNLATSFSADFSSDFLVFRLAFFSSISFWIASISVVRVVTMVYFSTIWDTISDLGRFLLPFVLGILGHLRMYVINVVLQSYVAVQIFFDNLLPFL